MTFKRVLTHGAALAALGLALGLAAPLPGLIAPTPAQAQGVSISIGTFYDRLAPYGEWVFYRGRYVWVPTHAGPGWRPYVVGQWVFTEPYGWMWVSNEPYAWAVYHYGRWGFDPALGWFWVPDTVWGPAWVDWRNSDEDIAWAPLPPATIGVSFGPGPHDLPIDYWVAVPVTGFLAPNLSVHVVYKDRDRLDRILKRTRKAGRVRVENNIVVNNVINVNFIEERTKKKVVVRKVERVGKADESGKVKGDEIAVFAPTVEKTGDAKPKKVKNVDEVVKERREKQPKEAAIGEEPAGKKAKGAAVEEETTGKKARAKEAVTEQPSEEPSGKKARKQEKARATTDEPVEQTPSRAEQRQKKQKTGLVPDQGAEQQVPDAGQGKKAERKARQKAEQPQQAQGGAEQPQGKKKKKQQGQETTQ